MISSPSVDTPLTVTIAEDLAFLSTFLTTITFPSTVIVVSAANEDESVELFVLPSVPVLESGLVLLESVLLLPLVLLFVVLVLLFGCVGVMIRELSVEGEFPEETS